MSATRPDHLAVRGAIALATRAPSVHNTQPWRWLVGDASVHLMADWSRHLPATDPDGRDLLISCGAALHHLTVALASYGWAGAVQRLPNPADRAYLAALEPGPYLPSEQDIALAAAIPKRRTDRRRFSSWPVPTGHLNLLLRRASRAGALLVPVTEPPIRRHLVRALAEAAGRQANSPGYDAELAHWTGRRTRTQDGVLAASTPAGPRWHGDTPMRQFTSGTLNESTVEDDDAGALLVLATPDDDPRSRLRAGEAASIVLLTATDLMLASCPLSQALEVAGTRAAIQEHVLDGAAVPQLILRIGWAPTAAEPLPESPRRPVHHVIGYLPGMAPRRRQQ
ncbi:MAG TPA: NAD(P)H nitroreductase [Actinophytocola sp.]|uniref:Acg family FMN-binding oxidoreductase n=1 Tax=Actinophytocola sp. TaxID=1872138 RepID=UPI002DBA8662|nr:NAD(P)H nitroreductase [Actinophytocola sp.]HEU5474942.1 NAD(P)H nitroreductase [Actinophytocola sp.]